MAHGATGSATGVNGEDLSSLLNLGATLTNVPGGTAHWTFAGNTNYAPASGDATVTITKATPIITWNNPAGYAAAGADFNLLPADTIYVNVRNSNYGVPTCPAGRP